MFESAEIQHDIDKASFEERLPQLRTDILNAQFEVLEARDFPVIVLLGGMAIHAAVATSLVIIALKSYSGFYKYIDVLEAQSLDLDWQTLMIVTVLGILGSYFGARYAKKMPQDKLKRWFGYFLILMGIYILARSLPEAVGLVT